MGLDNVFDDCKAEAGAAEFPASCFIVNIKTLKNSIMKIVVDTLSEIGDVKVVVNVNVDCSN